MDDRTGQPPLGIFYKNPFLHQTRLPGALLFAGPPCSYFVFMSSSIHKRSRLGPRGDESHCGVRLGNLLTENLAVAVRALLQIRDVKVVIEQPVSSAMFSLQLWVDLIHEQQLRLILTYMGAFGHFMIKGTRLLGNLSHIQWSPDTCFSFLNV